MVIQIDDKEGAIGIKIRDFQDKKGDFHKGYNQYFYCDKETKEKMTILLEKALDRIKFGARI